MAGRATRISESSVVAENIIEKCKNPPRGLKEAWVKDRVKEMLKYLGAWWFMPQNVGLGVNGIPDFIGVLRGIPLAIETKRGKDGKLAWAQEEQLKLATKAGAYACVVDESGLVHMFKQLIAINDGFHAQYHTYHHLWKLDNA